MVIKKENGKWMLNALEVVQLAFLLGAFIATYFIIVNRVERVEDAQIRHEESIKKHEDQLKAIEITLAKINVSLQTIKEDVKDIKNHFSGEHAKYN